jgi:betaine-aldehyde dehydrogenase
LCVAQWFGKAAIDYFLGCREFLCQTWAVLRATEHFRAVNEIESGIVWVNTPLNDNDAIPFGGRKFTGSGRELGAEGLDQFRRSKMVMIAPTAQPDPEWFPYPDGDAFNA